MATSTFQHRGAQRILVGSLTAAARVVFTDQDGTHTDAAGVVTANVARVSGVVLATGRSTASGAAAGTYSVELTAAECAVLDLIEVTWLDGATVRAVTRHRIVGGFMFSINDLQSMSGMASIEPAEMLVERDSITDLIQKHTNYAWVPSFDVDSWALPTRTAFASLVLRGAPIRALRSVTIEGNTGTLDDVDISEASGVVSGLSFYGNCSIGYEHGFDAPDVDLREAALEAARDRLLRRSSGLSDRTRAITNDIGVTQQFSFAGKNHPTGIDSVDAVIMAAARRPRGMA